jgi:hypothetical protein
VEGGRRDQGYVAVGLTFAALAAALTILGERNESTAYVIGGVVGRLFLAALIAYVIRFAYLRLSKNPGDAVEVPPLVIIGGTVALVLSFTALGQRAEENRDTIAAVQESIAEGVRECPDPLPPRLGDARLKPASPRVEEELRAFSAQQSPVPGVADSIGFSRVIWPDGQADIISLIPFDVPDDPAFRSEVVEGATMRLEQSGAEITEKVILGRPAVIYEIPGVEFGAVTTLECHLMTISALEPGRLEELASLAIEAAG